MADSPRIEELKRRVQSDPASIAFAALAEEYRRAGRFEEAIQTCTTGLVRHPSYLSAHVTLGRALIEVGKLPEARTELEYVLKLAPENLAAIRGLAEIHHRIGDEPGEHHTEATESTARLAEPAIAIPEPAPAPAPVIPIKIRVATSTEVQTTATSIPTAVDDRQQVPAPISAAPSSEESRPSFAGATLVFNNEAHVSTEPSRPSASHAAGARPVDPALAGLEEFLNVIIRARGQRAAIR